MPVGTAEPHEVGRVQTAGGAATPPARRPRSRGSTSRSRESGADRQRGDGPLEDVALVRELVEDERLVGGGVGGPGVATGTGRRMPRGSRRSAGWSAAHQACAPRPRSRPRTLGGRRGARPWPPPTRRGSRDAARLTAGPPATTCRARAARTSTIGERRENARARSSSSRNDTAVRSVSGSAGGICAGSPSNVRARAAHRPCRAAQRSRLSSTPARLSAIETRTSAVALSGTTRWIGSGSSAFGPAAVLHRRRDFLARAPA